MKTHLIAAALALLPLAAHAQGTLFQKEISVPAAQAALHAPPPADPRPLINALRSQVLEASNRERAFAGLSPLTADPVLDAAAARYSEKMRDYQFFDHVAPDGETLDGRVPRADLVRYESLGENLWSGEGALDWRAEAISAEAAANWVESPGHRENILDPAYTLAGVGSAMSGDQLYITMLYATPVENEAQAVLYRDYGEAPTDIGGLTQTVGQSVTLSINASRAQAGIAALTAEPILTQIATRHAEDALVNGGVASGGVLDRVFNADPTRTGNLAAGFWRGSGALIWRADEVTKEIIDRWAKGQVWVDALDPGFDEIGVGVSSDGERVLVTVLFGEASGQTLY